MASHLQRTAPGDPAAPAPDYSDPNGQVRETTIPAGKASIDAIASLHADRPQDWPQLAALYGELARRTRSPVVELNRAAAIAETGQVETALALVERLELDHYHYLHTTRAELLRRLGRAAEARTAYERALELVHSDPERRFLERRLAALRH